MRLSKTLRSLGYEKEDGKINVNAAATDLGLQQKTLYNYIECKQLAKLHVLDQIAKGLNVSISELIEEDPEALKERREKAGEFMASLRAFHKTQEQSRSAIELAIRTLWPKNWADVMNWIRS